MSAPDVPRYTLCPCLRAALAEEARQARLAAARAEECPACEGRGGVILDDWGYGRDDCRACSGTGLRAPRVTA